MAAFETTTPPAPPNHDRPTYQTPCPPQFRDRLRDPDATHLIVEEGRRARAGDLVVTHRPGGHERAEMKVHAEGDGAPWAVACGEYIAGRWSDQNPMNRESGSK